MNWQATLTSVGVALCAVGAARADCPTIDFENLAVGTAVTNQYAGVTFSLTVEGASRSARIIDPTSGTTSGTRALGADQAAMGFWPGALRMVFDDPHDLVTFHLGDFSTGIYAIRAFDAPVGGAQIGPTLNIDLEGNGEVAVHRFVSVPGPAIRRIEIDSSQDNQAVIDDLSFQIDTTPPVAAIDQPDPLGCACSPIQIMGTADDADGRLFRRRLYYSQDANGPWTLLSNSPTPVNAGLLYSWNTTGLAGGYYFVRLIAINDCGLETTVVTMIYVDRGFDRVEIRTPLAGQVVGGGVCIDGTVDDHCPRGANSYQVLYGVPNAPGPIGPVDPARPSYPGTVINDPLATPVNWITDVGPTSVADGTWRIAVQGTDSCGFSRIVFRDVVVDNTAPVAVLTSPSRCLPRCGDIQIRGTASDAHLAHWYLEYTGGDAAAWVALADGAGPVVGGLFFTWNTDGLRRCAYTIRLRVYDSAVVNCVGSNAGEYTVSLDLRDPADFNLDGVVNSADFFDFLGAFFALPPC